MQFNKSEVAAKFEIAGEHNPRISAGTYNGPLADAPLAVVEGMVARKNQLVKVKATTPPPAKGSDK